MLINDDFNNVNLPEKADLILIDIPYNLGLKAYASNNEWWIGKDFKNGRSEKANSKFFDTDENFSIETMLSYCKRNLKDNSHAVIFCSYEQQFEIINNMKKYGFKKYTPLVFIKNRSAEVLKTNMRILGACEYGLVLYNGTLGLFNNNGKQVKNYFEFKVRKNEFHPNQKPVELLETFIKLYTNPNDLVLDFVMGSGSTGVASMNLNRRFIGIEIEEKYFNIAKNRLEKDIEFDVLKALNTDLPDDIEMG